MKPPVRWLVSEGAPEGARELLASARPTRRLTTLERQRTLRRASQLVTIPAAASVAWIWAKVAAAAVVATATVTIAVKSVDGPTAFVAEPAIPAATARAGLRHAVRIVSPPASPPATPPEAAASEVASDVEESPSRAAVAPTPREDADRRGPKPSVPAAEARTPRLTEDALTRETRGLETARQSLEHDPARALAALEEHARAFPNGQLSAEREVLRVEALRRVGRGAEAEARANALLSNDESDLYRPRVRRVLGAPPASTNPPR